jgi:hypothetical protein
MAATSDDEENALLRPSSSSGRVRTASAAGGVAPRCCGACGGVKRVVLAHVAIALLIGGFILVAPARAYAVVHRTPPFLFTALDAPIPHIFHQSWKTTEIPDKFKAWSESWHANHPSWEFKLWTDVDNRAFIAKYYPWFLPTFDGFETQIMRCDASRIFYLFHYGGLYADLDFESLKPIDPLLEGHRLVLGRMADTNLVGHGASSIPNAIMASAPGHEFWMWCINRMVKGQKEKANENGFMAAEFTTGPGMIYHAVNDYLAAHPEGTPPGFVLYDPKYLYPYSWVEGRFGSDPQLRANCEGTEDHTACKAMFPEAYAITYWTHSWEDSTTASTKKAA